MMQVINDTQRLDEITEWCRNKPEEAAMRIMECEGMTETMPSAKESLCGGKGFLGEPTRATLTISEEDIAWGRALQEKQRKCSVIDIEGLGFIATSVAESSRGGMTISLDRLRRVK
jgi:hypothetical protein